MTVLEEHLSVSASVYNPYCFCVMRHVTTITLFILLFKSEFYCLDTFFSFFNISSLVYQNVLLLFRLVITFHSILTDNTIEFRYLLPTEVLYNVLMILPSITEFHECKAFYLSYL